MAWNLGKALGLGGNKKWPYGWSQVAPSLWPERKSWPIAWVKGRPADRDDVQRLANYLEMDIESGEFMRMVDIFSTVGKNDKENYTTMKREYQIGLSKIYKWYKRR